MDEDKTGGTHMNLQNFGTVQDLDFAFGNKGWLYTEAFRPKVRIARWKVILAFLALLSTGIVIP